MDIQSVLSSEFQTAPAIIGRIVSLIDEGNTIPFIARYRKEMTGAMDDQKLREISERLDYLRGLDKRREAIAASITEQGKMTDELEKKLAAAATLSELEDVYRPYKQKRRTRAMIAKEKGVQPLADAIFAQRRGDDPLRLAQAYVSEEKGVPDAQTAVQLAQDILAEQISDDAAIRASLRALYRRTGMLRAVAAKEGESVYAQYADYREPVLRAAGHRILAINRGEREEWLKVAVECDDEQALQIICRAVIEPGSACCDVVRAAAKDAWGRLISPSLEREIRNELTDEWKKRGMQKGKEYAILTDEITHAWSGMNTRQYKNLKGLRKENLRDDMSDLELVLTMLAEASTTDIAKAEQPQGFDENQKVARRGGNVAGVARKALEAETGKPVVTAQNAESFRQLVTDIVTDAAQLPEQTEGDTNGK